MIINGGSRANFRFFARHLMRTDENDRVQIAEIRGLMSDNLLEALREMDAVASGTRTENFMYHANLNPTEAERLTPEQWGEAVDRLERNLGLEGHARIVVEHEKHGRTHRHVIWNRIDPDTMTAVPDSFNYAKHEATSREIEEALGLEPVECSPTADRKPKDWESFRRSDSGIDPQAMKTHVTALWREADSGMAFKAALEEAGYILARGDRRDFVIIDQAGDDHSLARRISGVKAADIRTRMQDVDREALPSVAEARKQARDAAASDAAPDARETLPQEPSQPTPGEPAQTEREGLIPAEAQTDADTLLAEPEASAEPGAARRVSPWGRAWRVASDRARALGAWLHELWADDGVETAVMRLLEAGRELWTTRIGRDPAFDATEGMPQTESWVSRVARQASALWRDSFGCGPGFGPNNPSNDVEHMAEQWVQDAPTVAPPLPLEPETMGEGADAVPESEGWDIEP